MSFVPSVSLHMQQVKHGLSNVLPGNPRLIEISFPFHINTHRSTRAAYISTCAFLAPSSDFSPKQSSIVRQHLHGTMRYQEGYERARATMGQRHMERYRAYSGAIDRVDMGRQTHDEQ